MTARRLAALLLISGAAATAAVAPAAAQRLPGRSSGSLIRALDLEQRGRNAEAVAAFRDALGSSDMLAALLGLERVYAAMAQSDSLVPIADSLARAHPSETMVQIVRLRVLRYARKPAAATAAFAEWVQRAPAQITPYREYARILLETGDLATADSVIEAAQRLPGAARALAAERARVQSARGEWSRATSSWRGAVENGPHLVPEAAFALGAAPGDARDDIRRVLAGAPASAEARILLSQLELMWGSPAAAWSALARLRADPPAIAAWREFAERAEGSEAWLPARDAWRAVLGATKCDAETALRATDDAIRGGDAAGALAVLDGFPCAASSPGTARVAAALRVRALARSGKAAEATAALAPLALTDDERRVLTTDLAWAWVRAGDTANARAMMGDALADDSSGVRGWLAVYDGDIATARTALRESGTPSSDAVRAQAIIARTRADRAPQLGAAFLALARHDSVKAAALFEGATAELPDAAPLLLATAAEIRHARGDASGAVALWQRILDRYGDSADAPPAELALARALLASGDRAGAKAHAEHLILTYQSSALVPQARRLLDTLGGAE
ncbi:MAG TPA: hypothetical protein VG432_13225 [Gemmatimonadaceae bacterium]|nr:hypothetical protein [Gemmatimonadaceae bacterium]